MFLLRKSWFRRPRPDTEKLPCPPMIVVDNEKAPDDEVPQLCDISFTTTTPYDPTEFIANQPAVLNPAANRTLIHTIQSDIFSNTSPSDGEEETFYHLGTLITASCMPSTRRKSRMSTSTIISEGGRRESQKSDVKRESSIINLNIGDLPALPLPRSEKRKGRPGPRYSPLPPPFVPKSLIMRPEVRF
ncbi:uncharacterized protein N7506_006059 [Penicillium brevicompactum]|uniref:uncharacterized protein n=1 Tax=Penicillium brevicompactum TaxID=5074 RepID=UPI00253F7859|nr:uncharacterized protein N7506_006059 [Penicillium brevicompactum]KAJ5332276.1 hypothetical protein N7506_006059 [Penicillium brevicompactum]